MNLLKLILCLPLLVLIACNQKVPASATDIKVEYLDDVSPVKVQLSVDHDLHASEWRLDDGSAYYPDSPVEMGQFLHVFDNSHAWVVKFKASTNDGELIFGETVVEQLPLASQFVVNGVYFKEPCGVVFNGGYLSVNLSYNNREEYISVKEDIFAEEEFCNDTLWFDEPLRLEVKDLGTDIESQCIFNVSIYNNDQVNNGFRGMFNLKDSYYIHRPRFNNQLQVRDNNGNEIYLIVDWLP